MGLTDWPSSISKTPSDEQFEKYQFINGLFIDPLAFSSNGFLLCTLSFDPKQRGLAIYAKEDSHGLHQGNVMISFDKQWRMWRDAGLVGIVDAQRQTLPASTLNFDGREYNVVYYGTPVRLPPSKI